MIIDVLPEQIQENSCNSKDSEFLRKIEVIISSDGSWKYLSYLPLIASSYQKLSSNYYSYHVNLALIESDRTRKLANFAEYCGVTPHFIPKAIGIDSRVQAKCQRLWLAQKEEFTNSLVLISDLDMLNLNNNALEVLVRCPRDTLMKWGVDHKSYLENENIGKWPMDKTVSYGKVFRQIVNPNKLTFESIFLYWSHKSYFVNSDPFNDFSKFSDESLLASLNMANGNSIKCIEVKRSHFEKSYLEGRVDRFTPKPRNSFEVLLNYIGAWQLIFASRNIWRILSNKSFEFHGPRPFKIISITSLCIIIYGKYNFFKLFFSYVKLKRIINS